MADVILKNWDGEEITYSGIETLAVATPEGELVKFTQGELGEDITADADFSGGDMVLGYENLFVKNVTVKKPPNLLPENIVKDVEIAGVIGTSEGGGGGIPEGEMLKYFVYQIDGENKEIILYKPLYEELYADTGSYDISIPDKFGAYSVVISSEGVPN